MHSVIRRVNIDLDGVMYDLLRSLSHLDGYECVGKWYGSQDQSVDFVGLSLGKHINNNCFQDGYAMSGLDKMLLMCRDLRGIGYEVNVLSSVGKDEHYDSTVAANQKRNWLSSAVDFEFDNIYMVRGSKVKLEYAGADTVLIDDYDATKARYEAINAPFVHYLSADQSIDQMREMGILV